MQNYNEIRGRIHSVETLGALDGPGLRYVVFMQGCALRCQYCHNPDSWDMHAGTRVTVEEQAADIIRYRNYIRGVTLSGGEPLLQPDFVYALFHECHSRAGLHCAVDTSGAVPVESCSKAVNEADLILLDIKAFDDDTAREITGTGSGNSWAFLDYCEKTGKPVWIRHVLVPGKTLFEKDASGTLFADEKDFLEANPQLQNLAEKLLHYTCIERTDLLPFHKMGEFKWEEMGIPYRLEETPEPSDIVVKWSRKLFSAKEKK